jgi:hypothetical protein
MPPASESVIVACSAVDSSMSLLSLFCGPLLPDIGLVAPAGVSDADLSARAVAVDLALAHMQDARPRQRLAIARHCSS